MNDFVSVADASCIAPGTGLAVQAGHRELAVFNVDGAYYALDGRCPHRGGPLGMGTLEEGRVYCPLHGWAFDVRTGACFEKQDRPVRSYPTRILDGKVQVKLDTETTTGNL